MDLIVVYDPDAIAAAIEPESRTERAKVEEVFAEILACEIPATRSGRGPCSAVHDV